MKLVIGFLILIMLYACSSSITINTKKATQKIKISHNVKDFKVKDVLINSNFSAPLLMHSNSFLNIEFQIQNLTAKTVPIYVEVLLEPVEKSQKMLLIKSFGKLKLNKVRSFLLNWKPLNYLKGDYRLLFKVYLLQDHQPILKSFHYWGEYSKNFENYILRFLTSE